MGAVDVTARPPSRRVRWFVALYLILFLGTGLIGIEAWPVTGWKLYAARSAGERGEWRLTAVAADGTERNVDFHLLPLEYREGSFLLRHLPQLPESERQAICLAWQRILTERAALAASGRGQAWWPGSAGTEAPAMIRIYRLVRRVPTKPGEAAEVIDQKVFTSCGG